MINRWWPFFFLTFAALGASAQLRVETTLGGDEKAMERAIDGDTATAIWPLQDRLVWEDGRSLTAYGHYHERYVRTADGWRIAALDNRSCWRPK